MSQGLSADPDLVAERQVTLTPGANVSVNAALGSVFDLTPVQNFQLDSPTNPVQGQKILFRILQDGVGSRVLTLDSKYRVPSDLTGFVLSTATNTRDILGFVYDLINDTWDMTGITKGYA